MKYNLLEMVQHITASMDSEEVNSITDTVESNQLAILLKGVYYDIATDLGLPEHEGLFELNELQPSADPAKPTYMETPDNVTRIRSIKYNNKLASETHANYVDCCFLPFDDFLIMQNSLREQPTTVAGQMSFVTNGETFELMYNKTKMPRFYTTIKDKIIIFDSYDSTIDTTLQKSKTLCQGAVYPIFTLSNTFTPDLDPTQFSYFINRAKARAFAELKQTQNTDATSEARRQKIIVQKRKRRTPDLPELWKTPRYGRK